MKEADYRTMDDYPLEDAEFTLFQKLIHKQTGIALTDAKRQLVRSRLQKRLRFHGLARFQDYYNLVTAAGDASDEMREMINCVTTNKTDFFREPHHFQFIANSVLPEMIRQAKRGERPRRLRVWHAGCSSGEEPYTMAVTVLEALKHERNWDVRFLASDIDTNVLAHAERGVYERERVEPVPSGLLRRYFLNGTGAQSDHVRAKAELRDLITFRQINLLAPEWPMGLNARFDIIFCRNVVIYFDKPTQRTLFARYAERLSPGGHLFIGHSESLLGVSDAFENLGKTIYRLPTTAREMAA